jgi:exopolysaccharide biosynthesis polyprenyl glycosylphosphotransferase
MSARILEKLLIIFSDIFAFAVSFYIAVALQVNSGWVPQRVEISKNPFDYSVPFLTSLAVWFFIFIVRGLYRKWILQSWSFQVERVFFTTFFGCLLLCASLMGSWVLVSLFEHRSLNFLNHPYLKTIAVYFLSLSFLVLCGRFFSRSLVLWYLRSGYGASQSLIIGTNDFGKKIQATLLGNPQFGQKVVGYVQINVGVISAKTFNGLPILGELTQLKRIIHQRRIQSLILTQDSSDFESIVPILRYVSDLPIPIYLVPSVQEQLGGFFKTSQIHGLELKELFPHHLPRWQAIQKRFLDVVVALSILVISLPILIISIVAIKLDSSGSAFYSQERMGQYGRKFKVYKLRSMCFDAEKNGPQWATRRDSRVTRVGYWLRKLRIDEIPQVWCVLQGHMSMVGPRPEREHFVQKLKKEIPLYGRRLLMKPGLTGWAQVSHHYDSSVEDVKIKLQYDLEYFERLSIGFDLLILFRTVGVVLTGKGAQ